MAQNYSDKDAQFDAEALGKCPLCRQELCWCCEGCGANLAKTSHKSFCKDREMYANVSECK